MFKKKSLTLFIAAVMGASSAYAATVSLPTEKVVGFKPFLQSETGAGAIEGELKVGQKLTVKPEMLAYFDPDYPDAPQPNYRAFIYSWKLDDIEIGNSASVTLPNDAVGKTVSLEVTPYSEVGDPLKGKLWVLKNVKDSGVNGGGDNGEVKPDGDAKPFVSNLNIAGTLAVGNQLNASYQFNSNGGDLTDSSTYAWDIKGQSAANVGSSATNNGVVPGFDITLDHAGDVLEVSVQAKNGEAVIGNTLTVGTDGAVNNEDNGSGSNPDEGGESGKNPDLEGGENGKTPYVPADPASVSLEFTSTAKLEDNDIEGIRPVAQKDEMTVKIDPVKGASPTLTDYQYRWFADSTAIEGANGYEFTPGAEHQGMAITVEVEPKQ